MLTCIHPFKDIHFIKHVFHWQHGLEMRFFLITEIKRFQLLYILNIFPYWKWMNKKQVKFGYVSTKKILLFRGIIPMFSLTINRLCKIFCLSSFRYLLRTKLKALSFDSFIDPRVRDFKLWRILLKLNTYSYWTYK